MEKIAWALAGALVGALGATVYHDRVTAKPLALYPMQDPYRDTSRMYGLNDKERCIDEYVFVVDKRSFRAREDGHGNMIPCRFVEFKEH